MTVGLEAFAFDRLVGAMDEAVAAGLLPADTFIQYGSSTRRLRFIGGADYLDYPQMCEHVRNADVIVTHAGVGTFLLCHDAGKVPVILPRWRRLGEHVDDHQVEFSHAVADLGLAVVADPAGNLRGRELAAAIVAQVHAASAGLSSAIGNAGAPSLAAHVGRLLAGVSVSRE